MPHNVITQTRTVRLDEVPKVCCLLGVINGTRGKHMVEQFRVVLNGKDIKLSEVKPQAAFAVQIADVDLTTENTITVQLTGAPDAYVRILVSGKKGTPPQ